MTILAVDGSSERLTALRQVLLQAFPEDTIITESDSLRAGKYSFSHPVDILFAAMEMPRLDGLKLIEFVRHAAPDALAFLLTDAKTDMDNGLWRDEIDGVITYPVTEACLCDALQNARRTAAACDTL